MVDDICALTTPYGVSAIAVIRCSGPNTINLVNNIFKGKDLTKAKSHTINYGYIMDGNEKVDQVLCNLFRGPQSFDGEDIIEINCHGGIFVTNKIIDVLLKNGFRLAERGEFSKRAYLNHKLDLTEAEAVMDIISAKNDIALKASLSSLRSSTKKLINKFRDDILDILAKIEVNIDYPEYEDSIDVTHKYLAPIIDDMLIKMKEILDNSKISRDAIHGIKTAIVGKPNVGKSSLLNMMLDEDKAIVSDIAGTTRDLVEGVVTVRNVTLNLVDTAGIRESDDYVEKIGIERSKKAIDSASLVLLVLDASKELEDIDNNLLEYTKDKNRIIILNKTDLNKKIDIDGSISISALKNEGMDLLVKKILDVTSINLVESMNGNFLNNNRQVDLMNKAYNSLIDAKASVDSLVDISLIEIDIKNAFDYLGNITGDSSPDELITALFTKFCLGK